MRIVARPLELEELLSVLSKEHRTQTKRLADIIDALAKKDYARGARLASEFDNSSIQHIVDEENVLLKLFIDAYGRKGADDAIKVFQQHRTMHRLADAISKQALTTPKDLGSMPSDFDKLVRSHFEAEEKRIFPWALKTHNDIEQASKRTNENRQKQFRKLLSFPILFHVSDRFSWLHTPFCRNLRITFVLRRIELVVHLGAITLRLTS